jgi:hypothetical protein
VRKIAIFVLAAFLLASTSRAQNTEANIAQSQRSGGKYRERDRPGHFSIAPFLRYQPTSSFVRVRTAVKTLGLFQPWIELLPAAVGHDACGFFDGV